MTSADARLAAVLGSTPMARLRTRLRARLSRGLPLAGKMTLVAPTPDERSAIERLFGRMTHGVNLQLDLDELAQVLRNADLAPDLASALVALDGPVINRRAETRETDERWKAIHAEAREAVGAGSIWDGPLGDAELRALCRRVSAGDPDEGAVLVGALAAVLRRLPAEAVPLAELAAVAVGDSHALDVGAALATVVLRAVSIQKRLPFPEDPDQRRAAWAGVGVLADELSAPALVLNLTASPTNHTGRALSLAAEAGEPYRLSTRQLLRDPPTFQAIPGDIVFLCENPSVVAAAANRLGSRSKPLLCTEGQPKTALRLMLARLREIGVGIAYHGDFDWPGIQIANGIIQRFEATPWRMNAQDYLGAPAGIPLAGPVTIPCWDPALGDAMRTRDRAIHEEAVVDILVADLDKGIQNGRSV